MFKWILILVLLVPALAMAHDDPDADDEEREIVVTQTIFIDPPLDSSFYGSGIFLFGGWLDDESNPTDFPFDEEDVRSITFSITTTEPRLQPGSVGNFGGQPFAQLSILWDEPTDYPDFAFQLQVAVFSTFNIADGKSRTLGYACPPCNHKGFKEMAESLGQNDELEIFYYTQFWHTDNKWVYHDARTAGINATAVVRGMEYFHTHTASVVDDEMMALAGVAFQEMYCGLVGLEVLLAPLAMQLRRRGSIPGRNI